MKTIQGYLIDSGYTTVSDSTYSHIDEWLEWYQGEVEKFHKYKIYNGMSIVTEKRYRLGMAKKICEDWANLLLNEKLSIKAGNFDNRLNEILHVNNFRTRANQLIELMCALGTGAFVEYLDGDGQVCIDYVRADMIYPLKWENGDIIECAFGSYRTKGNEDYIYLQIHRKGIGDGENASIYYIENKLINAETGKECEMEEVAEIIKTGSQQPLFQIIVPNICNNIDLDSPLGISIYANSISQLKSCDLIYDSYINEYRLGRKRILVPITAAKIEMQKNGVTAPVFDPSETVFYAMPGDRDSDLKITEVDMDIRATEHELGIQRALDILSLKCGMGTGRYQFDSSGVKTATEVISDKSDLYQNLKKNTIVIKDALINLVKAIAFLDGYGEVEVIVDFDDSIIEDVNTTIDRNIKLVQAGLRSKLSAIMEINKCSEQEAAKEMEKIAEESQISGQDIDWTDRDSQDEEESETEDVEEDDVDESTRKSKKR